MRILTIYFVVSHVIFFLLYAKEVGVFFREVVKHNIVLNSNIGTAGMYIGFFIVATFTVPLYLFPATIVYYAVKLFKPRPRQ